MIFRGMGAERGAVACLGGGGAAALVGVAVGSGVAVLYEAEHVAGGVAEGAVADAVRLVDRLLQDLGA
ncbi:hypothetical protein GCM10022214_21710 [Actinomadura miaoliensis]|uniref:Uncharacterized protein n=1 Tax=Actinomadura miaoliensis TaxID=430685 RepID=A0ABP7VGR5_9ACTN